MIKITTIEQLKTLCCEGESDFFIALGGGIARSSKSIYYNEDTDTFSIINEIDDSEIDLTSEELEASKVTNIVVSMKGGNFYCY